MLGKSKLECSDNEGTKTLNSEHYCGVKFQEMMRKSKQVCSDNRNPAEAMAFCLLELSIQQKQNSNCP